MYTNDFRFKNEKLILHKIRFIQFLNYSLRATANVKFYSVSNIFILIKTKFYYLALF